MNFKEIIKDLFHLFYPNQCILCCQELLEAEEQLCFACLHSLPETDFQNLRENPVFELFKGRVNIEKAISLYYFNKESGVQEIVHEIKYRNNKHLAIYMGKMIGLKLKEQLKEIEMIIPVPLAPLKEAKRGYNQSACLCQGLSLATGISLTSDHLFRIKNTETQTKKTRVERLQNMQNAFQWKNPEALLGKKLLLVDDVITTGITLESCLQAWPLKLPPTCSFLSLAVALDF